MKNRTCSNCGSKLFSVGSSHLSAKHLRIKGIGSFELNLISLRCVDLENCDGGIEVSEHNNSRHAEALSGHTFTQEGKYMGQIIQKGE